MIGQKGGEPVNLVKGSSVLRASGREKGTWTSSCIMEYQCN